MLTLSPLAQTTVDLVSWNTRAGTCGVRNRSLPALSSAHFRFDSSLPPKELHLLKKWSLAYKYFPLHGSKGYGIKLGDIYDSWWKVLIKYNCDHYLDSIFTFTFFLMYRWYAWSRELQNVHFPSSAHISSSVLAHKVGTSKSQVWWEPSSLASVGRASIRSHSTWTRQWLAGCGYN